MEETAAYDAEQGRKRMQIETTKKRFTVEDYYRMAEVGILTAGDRVELIDGEIIQMTAIGVRHLGCVNAVAEAFVSAFKGRAVVSGQNPVRLSDVTEPQPDIVLLKFRKDFYREKRPMAADALLVVEVSDTTLAYDLNVKVPLYAEAGVPEVWIEDVNGGQIFVFRDPAGRNYDTRLVFKRGDSMFVQAFPETVFAVTDFLG